MARKIPKQAKITEGYQFPVLPKKTSKTISYSQFSSYRECPHRWYLTKVKKLALFEPSIHTVFGSAFHDTLQHWLKCFYTEGVKKANEINLEEYLGSRLRAHYKQQKAQTGWKNFSSSEQMEEFYEDGVAILDYLKKRTAKYFPFRGTFLVGIESRLLYKLVDNVYFQGYVDVILYDENTKRYKVIDIKTSTSGWNKWAKDDDNKKAQLVLYKEFLAVQYNIPVDQIDVEYFIVKRKVPLIPDYPAMARRIQTFTPASGTGKRNEVKRGLKEMIEDVFDENGEYKDKAYDKRPSKSTCKFCVFKNNPLCPEAIQ